MLQSVNTEVTGRLAGDPLQGVRWSLAVRGMCVSVCDWHHQWAALSCFPNFPNGLGLITELGETQPSD